MSLKACPMFVSDLKMCQCLVILVLRPFEIGLKVDTRDKGSELLSFGLGFNKSFQLVPFAFSKHLSKIVLL